MKTHRQLFSLFLLGGVLAGLVALQVCAKRERETGGKARAAAAAARDLAESERLATQRAANEGRLKKALGAASSGNLEVKPFLFPCPVCKREISSSATACPGCGDRRD